MHSITALDVETETSPELAVRASPRARKVVFFGHFGPVALALGRSCRDAGIQTYLLIPGGNREDTETAHPSLFAGVAHLDPALSETPHGLHRVAEYVKEIGAQAITAQAESHCRWLARNAEQFGDKCRVLLPSFRTLELLASKERQIELAKAARFDVLPTCAIRTPADVNRIDPAMFPVCLRPVSPGVVEPWFRVLKANTPQELAGHIRNLRSLTGTLLVQPFRDLPNLIVHCARHRSNGDIFALDAFLVDRKFEGFALRMKRIELPARLQESIQEFSRLANLSGVYHFDFLHDPSTGATHFLEVNTRFGGTTDKVVRLGVDEPYNCLAAYGLIARRTVSPQLRSGSAVVNKRTVLKHLFTVLGNAPEPWDFPQESRAKGFLRSIADLLLARDSIFCWRDLRGTLRFHLRLPTQFPRWFKT